MHYSFVLTALYLCIPCYRAQDEVQPSSQEENKFDKRYTGYGGYARQTHRGMVQALCKHGHIYSEVVRNAMLRVDRKNFFTRVVPDPYRIKSRTIGFGADMSSPHIHAQMLELLKDKIKPGARVLDIGSGSGYLTACLAYMAGPTGRVFGVEHVMELAESSIKNIDKGNSELLDQGRVQFVVWNGKHGYERESPYDIIHVAPSYFNIPQKLLDQLVPGGRMIMPVGEPFKGQNLTIIDKLADGYTIVTTVVRRVRTNPLYRDRFQQKKYYNELRRKAAERFNNSLQYGHNLTNHYGRAFKTRTNYVFMTNRDPALDFNTKQEPEDRFDHSLSGQVWNPKEEGVKRDLQKSTGGENVEQTSNGNERTLISEAITVESTPKYTPIYPNTALDSDDYEMRSTTQWRWRHYFTYRTDNWNDYDGGFDKENKYNIDGVDHGIKLDHTEGNDYIYPDHRNMTGEFKMWGNCEQYKKWYNANYVGVNSTPWNPVFSNEIRDLNKLDTKKPLPPNFFKDAARDSFPDHLFPVSDYFN